MGATQKDGTPATDCRRCLISSIEIGSERTRTPRRSIGVLCEQIEVFVEFEGDLDLLAVDFDSHRTCSVVDNPDDHDGAGVLPSPLSVTLRLRSLATE